MKDKKSIIDEINKFINKVNTIGKDVEDINKKLLESTNKGIEKMNYEKNETNKELENKLNNLETNFIYMNSNYIKLQNELKENKAQIESIKKIEEWKKSIENEKLLERIKSLEQWKSEYENKLRNYINKEQEKQEFINNSDILTKNHVDFLNKAILKDDPILKNKNVKWNLLYKATRDGEDENIFHNKCNDKGSTIIIVKTDKGLSFGGYTEQSWSGSENKKDNNAFVFSLDLRKIYRANKSNVQIYCGSCYGFRGGGSFTLRIYKDCLKRKSSYTQTIDWCNQSFTGFEKDYELTNGEEYFLIREIEAYQIILI